MSMQESLPEEDPRKEALTRYIDSMTVHGIPHVIAKGGKKEKMAWILIVSTAVALCLYISRDFVKAVIYKETKTVLKVLISNNII